MEEEIQQLELLAQQQEEPNLPAEESVQEITQDVPEIPLPETNTQPQQAHVSSMAAQDVFNIRKLVQAGVVTPLQGQNLIQQVIQRAYSVITDQKGTTTAPQMFDDTFFTRAGRTEVLDYIKQSCVDKEDIPKITELVEKVEKAAIEGYLKNQERERQLNEMNEAAKRKMRVNAQKPCGSLKMAFTRDQIGKMSSAEFAKYERSIMEQLRQGLIK